MTTLFSSTVPLVGSAPWSVGAFTLEAHKSISITAFGLGADDLICIQQVRNVQAGNANLTLEACGVNMPDDEVIAQSQQLLDCGIKVCICAKQPWVRIDSGRFPPGDYRLSVSGANVSNGTVVIEAEKSESLGGNSCSYCAVCEPAPAPPPPPPPPIPPVVYCPSRRLPGGGFGFDVADIKDPAATEILNACAGDVFFRPIYIYPSAQAGATVPVICDAGLLGYAANQSACAPACPCPDMTVTVNNTAPIVNVASPVNNFSPTTNVAAPTVNLPAPTIASQNFDSQNRLVTTMTNGTIYTSTLATC